MISFFRPSLCLLVFSFWMVCGAFGPSHAQTSGEAVAVPGSRVSLVPPEEFTLSDQFSGFFHEASTSSVVVNEMPAEAYGQLSGSFKPGFEANGMVLGERNELSVSGRPGFLIRGTQELNGLSWNKWLLVFGAEDFTGLVVISSPQIAEMPDQMALDVLYSTKILSSAGYDPRDALSYSFEETGDFEVQAVLQGNTANLVSKSGKDTVFVITAAPDLQCGSLGGREAEISRQALGSIATVDVRSFEDPIEIVVDDLPGLEQLARAVDQKGGGEMSVYQAMLFEDCRYYRFVGLVPTGQIDRYLPDFRRMTESFARK